MTQAEKAVQKFQRTDMIPRMGQRMQDFGPGQAHIFPDGSVAMHWDDGEFTVGELKMASFLHPEGVAV